MLADRRRRLIRAGLLVAVVYVALWTLTGVVGVKDVRSGLGPPRPEFTRIDYDPYRDISAPEPAPPWYYVSGGFSPCPFVVWFDYSWYAGSLVGEGCPPEKLI